MLRYSKHKRKGQKQVCHSEERRIFCNMHVRYANQRRFFVPQNDKMKNKGQKKSPFPGILNITISKSLPAPSKPRYY